MGKNTLFNKKKKMAKKRKKAESKSDYLKLLSLSDLLLKSQEHIDHFQYEEAQQVCQEALRREPDNASALEISGSLCLEIGNIQGALHCFGRAITLLPEEGYNKYLSMAQLMIGKEAVQCYQKGLEIMKNLLLQSKDNCNDVSDLLKDNDTSLIPVSEREPCQSESEVKKKDQLLSTNLKSCLSEENGSSSNLEVKLFEKSHSLKHQMSTVYCSISEIYMTDLCDEDDAESLCLSSINMAIESDKTNPEAYQQMANFLLVKQEPDEAKTFIHKSLQLWLPNYKKVDAGKAEAGSFDPVEVCPVPYAARLSTARILIELDDHSHALEVLDGLMQEDDEVVDVWYLLGWSFYLQGEEHRDAAKFNLKKAFQVNKASSSNDEQLVSHLAELLHELDEGDELEEQEEGDELEEELERNSSEEDNTMEVVNV